MVAKLLGIIGASLVGTVQLTFIILKLVGAVDWSWRLVLLPIMISLLLAAEITLVVGMLRD